MSFLRRKAAIVGAVLSVVMSAAVLGSSLIYAATGTYKSWKQYGSSWSSMTLGSSGETVAQSGCAVTSAAILMVQSGSVTSDDFTPGVIVDFMNQNGGFQKSGAINWSVLTSYAPDFAFVQGAELSGTQEQKAQKIESFLDAGYYVIAVVKNGGHFVAVDSVKGSNVTMMDPGSSSTSLFDKYAASGVISLRLFKGADSVITKEPQKIVKKEEPKETEETEVFMPDAPETAPYVPEITTTPETCPEINTEVTIPETTTAKQTTTTVATTTTSATTTTTTSATTTTTSATTTTTSATTTTSETTTTSTTAATTAKPVVTTEIVITTKAVTSTEAPVTTHTEAEEVTSETIVISDSEELAEPVQTVQIVMLVEAPSTAPDTEEALVPETEETRTVYIPEEQAEAALFQIKEQNLFMQVRFSIQEDLNLRQAPNTDSEILTVIPENTYLDVVEVDEEFKWGRVAFEGQEGWISLHFTGL